MEGTHYPTYLGQRFASHCDLPIGPLKAERQEMRAKLTAHIERICNLFAVEIRTS